MTYEDFITKLARRTGLVPEAVRDVLSHIPDVLLLMAPKEHVRTPLGCFICQPQNARLITTPDGEEGVRHAKLKVRLREGVRMERAGFNSPRGG